MKKILCLVLCMILLCSTLVSCADNVYEESKKNLEEAEGKWDRPVVEDITLDLYIVKGENTTDLAINDVADRINVYLDTNGFKTTLNLHYLSAEEYAEAAIAAADPDLADDKRADIVLITDEVMYDSLYADGKLADVSFMLSAAYKYGTLKTQIANALVEQVTVLDQRITEVDSNGTPRYQNFEAIYAIPNNHIISSYKYVLVDRDAAKTLHFGSDKIEKMLDAESEESLSFISKLEENGYEVDDCFKIVNGTFADYFKYLDRYYVNVAELPVPTKDEAFSGSFGIVRHPRDSRYLMDNTIEESEQAKSAYTEYYTRCMDVIYEINTSPELRNLLQYGVENINYSADVEVDDEGNKTTYVTSFDDVGKIYDMNPLYTGDVFMSYYCEQLGWNEDVALYGELQNKAENPSDSQYAYLVEIFGNKDAE